MKDTASMPFSSWLALKRLLTVCQRSLTETKGHPTVWKQSLREEIRLITFHSSSELSYWWFSSTGLGLDPVLLLLSQGSPLDGAEQATTLRWATVQMGAVSNISDHWGTLAANRPLRNPWFIICNRSYTLIFSPLGWRIQSKQCCVLISRNICWGVVQNWLMQSSLLWSALSYSQMKYVCIQLNPLSFFSGYIYINVNKKTVMDAVVKKIP